MLLHGAGKDHSPDWWKVCAQQAAGLWLDARESCFFLS